jgi:PAS domain S-box-containing protein
MSKQEPVLSWNIAGVFLLLFFGLLTAGTIYYTIGKRNITEDKHNELHAISSLKINQIHNWYTERQGDAHVIIRNRNFGTLFAHWLANKNDPYFPLVFDDLASSLNRNSTYTNIILADTSGRVCFSLKGKLQNIDPETKSFADRSAANKEIIFTDFYENSADNQLHIDIIAPVEGHTGGKAIISGVIILRIDPRRDVFNMIQSWPTPSKTAETLLVRREGNEVVYLKELRHRKHTALKLRLPLSNRLLPAVIAAEGKEGIFEGIDYRNVPVLADIRRIPDMPWFIVAKIDIEEIYAPINRLLAGVIIVTALLIVAAWGVLSWWWNRQRLKFYRLKYESEEKYRALEIEFENLTRYANDIIIVADENQKIIKFNERAVQAYWYTREELLGISLKDIRSPEAAVNLQEQLRLAEERNGLVFETIHRRKDESEFPVEVSLRFIQHDDKKYSLGIIRDISERKHAEDSLRKREEQLRTIFETSQAGIILVDPHGTVTFANQRMADMFGCPMEKLIGSSYPEHIHPAERETGDRAMRRLIAGEIDTVAIERHYLRADGGDFWGFISGRRLTDENGNLISLVGIIADMSDRKKAEEEIRRLNESLEGRVRERTAQLEEAGFRIAENAARLEAANKELEAFSYSVSHDLRAPLRRIDSFSQAILEEYEDRLDEKGRHYLDRVRESSRRMEQLIDDLLKFSRLGRAEIHAEQVDLSAFARSIAAELIAREPERAVEIIIAENVTATGDPALLKIAMENLLRNAWKFTSGHPRARIEFGTVEHSGTMEYFVRDDGAGFDMKYADRLFAPFQRLHGVDEFEGTGIGLALVRRIVNRHRGTIRAEGEVEKGATIYFTLGAS